MVLRRGGITEIVWARNKLVSKVFAQKKGGKSYDSYKYVFKFQWFQV